MQIKRDDIIFLDTNVIIEAERAGILKTLAGNFKKLATVRKCLQELDKGNKSAPDYIPVDTKFISEKFSLKTVTQKEIADLLLKLENEIALDPGEEELLAHINSQNINVYFICSPDRACIRAANKLGFIDKVISLEDLADASGMKKTKLLYHFSKRWLSIFKADLLLEK
ncbi:MAG TPA: hypothetical protein DET40_08830 [Lentisphaeria bacterium]|nr:MAG: hypothetical protein A2X45_19505 [Lentisphaerae bacterium GWF2_50_93]HCE43639.1 hypothetical protein [Lentisphaeria bacterium]